MSQKFRRGDRVSYEPRCGGLCSAVVRRAHRDGDVTIVIRSLLNDDGSERQGGLGLVTRMRQVYLSAGV